MREAASGKLRFRPSSSGAFVGRTVRIHRRSGTPRSTLAILAIRKNGYQVRATRVCPAWGRFLSTMMVLDLAHALGVSAARRLRAQ